MIIVTGANGHLGRGVVENLLARIPAERIVATVREPDQASALAERGVTVRAGDFSKPETLASAFEGAEQVLVVSPNRLGDEGRRWSQNAIEAARAVGARRVLYTSHMGTHIGSPFHDHFLIEQFLEGFGLPYTSLRHGYYAESGLFLIGRGIEAGEIRAPEDGPVSWTARADLAEADAVILANQSHFDGLTPALTGPEAVTLDQVAAMASDLTGREIKRVVVSDTEWREAQIAQGVPELYADMLLLSYQDSRRGVFAKVDPTLQTLLGRRPKTMRDVMAETLKPSV
jgi:NAD(P)H dehydrogenase (quinone)